MHHDTHLLSALLSPVGGIVSMGLLGSSAARVFSNHYGMAKRTTLKREETSAEIFHFEQM